MSKDSYRGDNNRREFKLNEEMEMVRRLHKNMLFYFQVSVWLLGGICTLLVGIFVRSLF